MQAPFRHVVIVGCGLLGTSLGLALRRWNLASVITGVGRTGSPSVTIAHQRGAIDRATDDAARAVAGASLPGEAAAVPSADLVVVCTPVRQFPETFRQLAPALAADAIVTDVGSTKRQVMQWAQQYLPPQVAFIGSHPMAGSEKSGPDAARENLYQNAVCLICNPERPAPAASARIAALWRALGMRVIPCDAAQHDRWVAAISHLPQVLASTLVNAVAGDSAALQAAAGGFTDTSRLASGDPTMWTDILLTNRQAVAEMIAQYQRHLAALKDAVEHGDEAAIRDFLQAAKTARDAFIALRRNTGAGGGN